MTSERIQINLRGHCLFCLGKINGNNGDLSPTCTPTSSPLSTPLRNRYHNIHSVPPEERLAPFTDLCRFLGVELPDSYAFGDGSEPEMLTPPLCHKCFELTARLCVLQDELQYVQSKISNTVKRVYQRVTGSCGSHKRRGALKREAFLKEFGRNSKDFLSRGRGKVSGGGRKVTDLVKSFQLKVIEKEDQFLKTRGRQDITIYENPVIPVEIEAFDTEDLTSSPTKENASAYIAADHVEPEDIDEDEVVNLDNSYCPLLETLRSGVGGAPAQQSDVAEMDTIPIYAPDPDPKPDFGITTIEPCEVSENEVTSQHSIGKDANIPLSSRNNCGKIFKQDITISTGVVTRSRARKRLLMQIS